MAISRLNGREKESGSTLYLVEGDTGEILEFQSLAYASDQSAPRVEWLTNNQLLLHGSGILAVVDYSTEPIQVADVRKDLFSLDIAYPYEITSWASVVDPAGESYYLAARVELLDNQYVYLYHSESGSVEIHHPVPNLLLFFSDDEWAQLLHFESGIPQEDEFEMVWVEEPERDPQDLVVKGHTPRNYPILFPAYLPRSSQIVFSSAQGISLVSIPDGETMMFWELSNRTGGIDINLQVSTNEDALVAITDGVALYHIPLQH